jgi:hypothetical protein
MLFLYFPDVLEGIIFGFCFYLNYIKTSFQGFSEKIYVQRPNTVFST